MARLLAVSVALGTALLSGPVWARLQLPAAEVYPIVEEVISRHGELPRLQRLGALPSVPREHYSWLIGDIAGYYTDWAKAHDPDAPIEESKLPLANTCRGTHSLSEKRHRRPAGQLIVVTFDCDESHLPPDGLNSRTVLYFLHFPEFKILQLFHSVGPRNAASYQRFLDLMWVRLLLQLEETPPA